MISPKKDVRKLVWKMMDASYWKMMDASYWKMMDASY